MISVLFRLMFDTTRMSLISCFVSRAYPSFYLHAVALQQDVLEIQAVRIDFLQQMPGDTIMRGDKHHQVVELCDDIQKLKQKRTELHFHLVRSSYEDRFSFVQHNFGAVFGLVDRHLGHQESIIDI